MSSITKQRAEAMYSDLMQYAREQAEAWVPRDNSRTSYRAERLRALIESDSLDFIKQGHISLADVEEALERRTSLKSELKACTTGDYYQRRAPVSCLARDVRFFEKRNPEKAAAARAQLEREAETFRDDFGHDALVMAEHESEIRAKLNEAEDLFSTLAQAYIYQCATIAAEAVANHRFFLPNLPIHYKKFRKAIETICDDALTGTGCAAYISDDGSVSVDFDWACAHMLRTCSSGTSVDLRISRDEKGKADGDKLEELVESMKSRDLWMLTTYAAQKLVTEYQEAETEMRKLAEEYRENVRKLRRHYRPIPQSYEHLGKLARFNA